MASDDRVLVCLDLRKRFGDLLAVDGVRFGVDRGEIYGVLGPNGRARRSRFQ